MGAGESHHLIAYTAHDTDDEDQQQYEEDDRIGYCQRKTSGDHGVLGQREANVAKWFRRGVGDGARAGLAKVRAGCQRAADEGCGHRHTFSAVQRKLAAIRTEVYAVIVDSNNGLGYKDITHNGREVYPSSSDASELDRAALLDLTLKSGGSTYFGGTKSSLQLNKIYRDVDREMRSQYTLGFYPDLIDGKRHTIRVRLHGVPSSKGFVLVYKGGNAVVVPRGAKNNIINLSETDDLKLCTIYSLPHHKAGIVRATKAEAEGNEQVFDGVTTEYLPD